MNVCPTYVVIFVITCCNGPVSQLKSCDKSIEIPRTLTKNCPNQPGTKGTTPNKSLPKSNKPPQKSVLIISGEFSISTPLTYPFNNLFNACLKPVIG